MNRLERQAGVRAAERKNYVAHVRRQDVEPSPKTQPIGRTARSLGAAKGRKIDKPLRQMREESPATFTEQVPEILARRGQGSVRAVAHAKLERAIAATGRKLTPRSHIDTGTEAVYHISPATGRGGPKLRKLEKDSKFAADEIGRVIAGKGDPGQYVILNEKLADDALKSTETASVGGLHRRYRRAHGTLKTALTMPMPSYHGRNLYGDLQNAYLEQSGRQLAGNVRHSAQAMREARQVRKSEGKLTARQAPKETGRGLKVNGKHMTYRELLAEAERHGGLNAGFSRDLLEMLGEHPGRVTTKLRNVGETRENLVRFASYLGARKKGLSAEDAAKQVMDLHFDYADLTKAERILRDVFPFYTFTARNAPLQVKKLVKRPGKYATVEKTRDSLAEAAGLPENWQSNLKQYEKLGVPFPIPGLKSGQMPLIGLPGLPLTDLNRVTTNPREQFFLTAQMATGYKALPELIANYSVFFRGQIDTGRKVAAPDWLHKALPKAAQKEIGLSYEYDKAQKKKVWKYKAKWDYALRQLPETSALFNLTSSGKNRRGQDRLLGAISLTGVRPQPYDPAAAKLEKAYKKRESITYRLKDFNRRNINKDNPTPRYLQLLREQKQANVEITRLAQEENKKGVSTAVPKKRGRKKVKKKSSGGDYFGGGGGSSSGGDYFSK